MPLLDNLFPQLRFTFKSKENHLQSGCIQCICTYRLSEAMYANLIPSSFILSTTGVGILFPSQV
jgi:hypothetical protein